MAYPVPANYAVNQGFRSYATAGVVGRWGGTEIETLVAMYGDYQHYGHAGADLACPIGTPVYAIAAGVVVWADWGYNLPGDDSWGPSGYFKRWGMYKNFPGICTVIWHPRLNKFSIYGHQSSNDEVKVGQQVREGQQIGKSGNTKTRGETVGPHLHIAVVGDYTNYSTGGKYIFGCEDPVPYFTTGSLAYAGETITPLEEDDMPTPEDLWNHPLDLDGQSFTAGDILVYARKNAAMAREEAQAAKFNSETAAIAAQQAPAIAVQTLLSTKLPAPDGSGEFTIADYITYGWWYSMQAKDNATAIQPIDPTVLADAIAQASAAAVASRLEITVKESK